jgi:urease beta subunit
MAKATKVTRPVEGVVVGTADPGRLVLRTDEIEINAGRRGVELVVANTGDRPIQVGSHFHFFEANSALAFDRERAFGLHLDVPSGTAVRFEPGEEKKVGLTEYAGKQAVYGFNGLTNGSLRDGALRSRALQRARAEGFKLERG